VSDSGTDHYKITSYVSSKKAIQSKKTCSVDIPTDEAKECRKGIFHSALQIILGPRYRHMAVISMMPGLGGVIDDGKQAASAAACS